MRILFADSLAESAVERLRAGGDVCVVDPSLTADSMPEHIAGFDALVVRSTKVTAAALDAADQLGLVVRAGAGTNTIDADRAAELGIFVCNVPGRNAIAVAELAIGLMFAIDRHIAPATADLRAGDWNKQSYSKARGLFGSTLGIIGMGAIGIEVAQRASACGLEVITEPRADRTREVHRRMAEIGVEEVADRGCAVGRQRHRFASRPRRRRHRWNGGCRVPGGHEARCRAHQYQSGRGGGRGRAAGRAGLPPTCGPVSTCSPRSHRRRSGRSAPTWPAIRR